MGIALVLFGLLCGLMSIGRLLWPNPDGSLENKNHQAFNELMARIKEPSLSGLIFKIFSPIVLAYYLPFYRPTLGLFLAFVLISAGIAFS